jgi:hypothetical protein
MRLLRGVQIGKILAAVGDFLGFFWGKRGFLSSFLIGKSGFLMGKWGFFDRKKWFFDGNSGFWI